jgi:flagellar basal-body rod protein FlgB
LIFKLGKARFCSIWRGTEIAFQFTAGGLSPPVVKAKFEDDMLKELLFGRTPIPSLGRGLDALHLRQRSIATNIANAQSSGFTRQVVDFEAQFQAVMNRRTEGIFRTHPNHLPPRNFAQETHPAVRDADERIDGPDAEEVVVEREMANLAQTQIKFEAEAKLAKQYFELLNAAIRGMT